MPSLAQVRSAVDSRLSTLWTNQILPRERAYFSAKGRYWQGIITTDLASLPNNRDADASTAEVAPGISRKPTDQAETWSDAGLSLGATIPMAIEIHTYDGPNGRGFVGLVWVRHNGNVYSRAQEHHESDVQGEPWRSFAWRRETFR